MRLRVGVIGLGRRWRRYRSILSRLRNHVEVRAVCDQIAHRGETVAQRLGCVASAGPVELLERTDVEAVLLLDAQWYGLWPLEYACRTKKPVLCAVSPTEDEHADAVQECIQTSRLPVLMALPALLSPATRHLRALLTHRLGQARLVRTDYHVTPSPGGASRDLLSDGAVLSLLLGCAWLLDDVPRSVQTIASEDTSFVTLVLRFGRDRLAQVNLGTTAVGRCPARFEVVAETGTAMAELPRRLSWRDADGRHAQLLPPRSAEQSSLEHFLAALRTGQPLWPSFADACQALTWLRAAVRSRSETQCITLR